MPRPSITDVVVVVGTRPEALKLAGVVRELADRTRLVHTGQHFDDTMWAAVAGDAGLPMPTVSLQVGGLGRGEQIGSATVAISRHLEDHPAAALVVQGDTNSTLAGALAGQASDTPVVHVESGMRSGDLTMPEEMNRLLTDRLSDVCCAPTQANADQLVAEGIDRSRIAVTGNTLTETIVRLLPSPTDRAAILATYQVQPGRFVLASLHRASNADNEASLRALLTALDRLAAAVPVLLPVHPRTRQRAADYGITPHLSHLRFLEPLPPKHFLTLEHDAALIASDSGGVQEEAALFRVPQVVLRDSTERPELLGTWARLLGDSDPTTLLAEAWAGVDAWRAQLASAPPPYPLTSAATKVVAALDAMLARRRIPV